MHAVAAIGLDIANSVFQVHGVDENGNTVICHPPAVAAITHAGVLQEIAALPGWHRGFASSHYWSRELQALGHTVKLMPPAYVKPYV
jgi:transposase